MVLGDGTRNNPSGKTFFFQSLPARRVGAHQRLEKPAVRGNAEMEQLVNDDEILEIFALLRKVVRERKDAAG